MLCGRTEGNLLTFRHTDGEPLQFCSIHSGARFQAAREALCEGRDPFAGGQEAAEEDPPPAAPAPVTAYELERAANMRRIEDARQRIFAGGSM